MTKTKYFPKWFYTCALVCLLVIIYVILYAPYGFENNDSGFILGLAHQVYLGTSLYDNIVYVRPPVTPILHSIVFYWPFADAPVFFDRVLFYFQIGVYATLSGLMAERMYRWSSVFTAVVSGIIFSFSVNAFPQMGWHTVDGIFFSVLALYSYMIGYEKGYFSLFSAALFSILAAGAKQSFYLMPLILVTLSIILIDIRRTIFVVVSLMFSIVMLLALFWNFGSINALFSSITSQTTLRDLFYAGILSYIKSLLQIRSIVAVGPFCVALYLEMTNNKTFYKFHSSGMFVAIWLYLLSILHFYYSLSSFSQPYAIIDSVFIVTLIYAVFALYKTRDQRWYFILAMYLVAWSSSISWGGPTTALYSAPSVITIAIMVHDNWSNALATKVASIAILPFVLFVFYFGHQFSYSLEETVRRESMVFDLSKVSSKFNLIKGTDRQLHLYEELIEIINQLGGSPYITMPNIPVIHTLTNTSNPIGMDWLLNAEIPFSTDILIKRINDRLAYAILFRNAKPSSSNVGKFGSLATEYVINNWKLMRETPNFIIYRNPNVIGNRDFGAQ
jgi:hypothetical protein